MAVISGGGGTGGGGGGLSDCWISPSDQAGQIDNILDRIAKIEQVLSLLLGMDVSAAQLADITQSAGVLTDLIAVASNAAGGWTTDGTFTGVAISTLGWTMSDGNKYPIVTMKDGVLQYGFNFDGDVSGAQSGSSASDYISVEPASATLTANKPDLSTINVQAGTAFGTSNLSAGKIDIVEAGIYEINVKMLADSFGGTGYAYMQVGAIGSKVARDYLYVGASYTTESHKASFDTNFKFEIETADLPSGVVVSFSNVSSLMGSAYQHGNVDIVKLA